jgi:hypothetical protein
MKTAHILIAFIAGACVATHVARAELPVEYAIWQEISSPDPSLRCWRMEHQIWCANAR